MINLIMINDQIKFFSYQLLIFYKGKLFGYFLIELILIFIIVSIIEVYSPPFRHCCHGAPTTKEPIVHHHRPFIEENLFLQYISGASYSGHSPQKNSYISGCHLLITGLYAWSVLDTL